MQARGQGDAIRCLLALGAPGSPPVQRTETASGFSSRDLPLAGVLPTLMVWYGGASSMEEEGASGAAGSLLVPPRLASSEPLAEERTPSAVRQRKDVPVVIQHAGAVCRFLARLYGFYGATIEQAAQVC
ncbi:hypothetical protein EON62_04095, partial [archaeon]